MTVITAEFDTDKESVKATMTRLISEIGDLTWVGDSGSFAGTGMASGVKGKVAVTEAGGTTSSTIDYSLPLKLKMFGGRVESEIRKGLEKAGGRVS